jgi:hypothetical protein
MLDHINSVEQLEIEAKTIDDFLNITCSEQPEDAIARGNDLAVHMARTGKMLADAKYWKDEAVKNSILQQLKDDINLPASALNKLIDSTTKRENYLVNWIERLNRTCTHDIEWLRTVVSFAKSEMNYK